MAMNYDLLCWQSLVVELTIVTFTILAWRKYFSPLRNIPGPFLASFTRLWHVATIAGGKQSIRMLELHRKHGHFVRIAHNEVSVGHPDAIRKVLQAPNPKSPWYKLMAFPDWRYQSPLSTIEIKAKNERTRWLASGFSTTNVIKTERNMDRSIIRLKDWIDKYADSGKQMELDKFITYCTFDVLGEVMFSKAFGFLENGTDIGDTIAWSGMLNMIVTCGGYYRWLLNIFLMNPIITSLAATPMGYLGELSQGALEARRNDPTDHPDVVNLWFQNHRKHPDRVSFRDMQGANAAVIGAGSDTISCAAQSFIYHLLRNPEKLKKARAEIEHYQKTEGACYGRVISFADAQKLKYVNACIKEGIRVFTPVQWQLARQAAKGGVTFGDQTFPEGTLLSVNPHVMHHNREIWGEDADEFRPERWLEEGASSREKHWIPWSAGFASCPGQNVAKMEMPKLIATLLRDYSFRQVNEGQEWSYEATFGLLPYNWPVYVEKTKP
ncbi:cytochrome P450 [Xylariaceae sp. AK1471]|nr:cytochrome P450 [Xylariaceae sp. AK1471]